MPETVAKGSKDGVFKVQKAPKFVAFCDHEWYIGKFTKHDIGKGVYGDYVKLQFTILKGEMEDGSDAKGKQCSAMMNAEINPKSKLFEFVQVFEDGRELELDEVIDLSSYYGKVVKVFIEDRKKKGDDDDKRFQNITKIRNLKKKQE